MVFKINIASKNGKTYKLELENEGLEGLKLNNKIKGNEILPDLSGYEFEITGASDKAGFPLMNYSEGVGYSKQLLSYEAGMHKRPKHEGKRKRSDNKPKGLRLRKTVRGNTISNSTSQINLKIIKEGDKKLEQVFEAQTKSKTPKENRKIKRAKAKEAPKAEKKVEEVKEEIKEEVKEE